MSRRKAFLARSLASALFVLLVIGQGNAQTRTDLYHIVQLLRAAPTNPIAPPAISIPSAATPAAEPSWSEYLSWNVMAEGALPFDGHPRLVLQGGLTFDLGAPEKLARRRHENDVRDRLSNVRAALRAIEWEYTVLSRFCEWASLRQSHTVISWLVQVSDPGERGYWQARLDEAGFRSRLLERSLAELLNNGSDRAAARPPIEKGLEGNCDVLGSFAIPPLEAVPWQEHPRIVENALLRQQENLVQEFFAQPERGTVFVQGNVDLDDPAYTPNFSIATGVSLPLQWPDVRSSLDLQTTTRQISVGLELAASPGVDALAASGAELPPNPTLAAFPTETELLQELYDRAKTADLRLATATALEELLWRDLWPGFAKTSLLNCIQRIRCHLELGGIPDPTRLANGLLPALSASLEANLAALEALQTRGLLPSRDLKKLPGASP